ncbi:hypothetical protein F5146DRAFT_1104015 [Armillaria mellea]|nr:hypothetical protein F5146DRAFT_1104015 [Armillaria mellea]
MSTSKLFQPITIGHLSLVQTSLPKASGYPCQPEIWTDKQIAAWKEVMDGLDAVGRQALPDVLKSPSALPPMPSAPIPRAMTKEEIKEYIDFFGISAANAVHKARFDGVEIHGANGFLVDEFIQSVSNVWDDEYGGSLENRARFPLEVIECVMREVGADRVGFRLSPWNQGQGMCMEDPIPTFSYLVSWVKELYPEFAYIHVVETCVDGMTDVAPEDIKEFETNDFIRKIWAPKPLISAGGYTGDSGIETADRKGDLIAYGQWYISNPDLPAKLEKNIPLTKYDHSTFYVPGDTSGVGFTDYPFASP